MTQGEKLHANPHKEELRQLMKSRRAAMDAGARAMASASMRKHVLKFIDRRTPAVNAVGVYASFGTEAETHVLIQELLRRRLKVALPLALHHPRRLEMRLIDRFPEGLRKGDFGILEPEPLRHPEVIACGELDLMIVPGLAFDKQGNRLGYGAGYIDRCLLTSSETPALGLAFNGQIVERVPIDTWDRKVNAIVTENGILNISLV